MEVIIKIFKVLLVVSIIFLIVIFAINEVSARGLLKPNPLAKIGLERLTWQNSLWQLTHLSSNFGKTWQETAPQLAVLKDRTVEVGGTAQTFIQTQVISSQSNSSQSSAPLQDKALDYAKYVYCQATVQEYEKLHPEVKK